MGWEMQIEYQAEICGKTPDFARETSVTHDTLHM
jgi:hypothetical protein